MDFYWDDSHVCSQRLTSAVWTPSERSLLCLFSKNPLQHNAVQGEEAFWYDKIGNKVFLPEVLILMIYKRIHDVKM